MPAHRKHGKMSAKGKPMPGKEGKMPKSHAHMTPEEHRKAMAEMEK